MVKNCDQGLENVAISLRPLAAFSSPRSQFFTMWTDPKPVNTCNIFIFPAANWLTSWFVYTTLSLNWLTCGLNTNVKRSNEQLKYNADTRQRKMKERTNLMLAASSSPVKFFKTVFPV